jgi:hypothetical protein
LLFLRQIFILKVKVGGEKKSHQLRFGRMGACSKEQKILRNTLFYFAEKMFLAIFFGAFLRKKSFLWLLGRNFFFNNSNLVSIEREKNSTHNRCNFFSKNYFFKLFMTKTFFCHFVCVGFIRSVILIATVDFLVDSDRASKVRYKWTILKLWGRLVRPVDVGKECKNDRGDPYRFFR